MNSNENLLTGWLEIARYLGVSRSTVLRRRKEMASRGVIFYRLTGSPPKREVAAYKRKVQEWVLGRSKKGYV